MAIKLKINFEADTEKDVRRAISVLKVLGEVSNYYEVNQWDSPRNYPGITDAEIEGDSNDD